MDQRTKRNDFGPTWMREAGPRSRWDALYEDATSCSAEQAALLFGLTLARPMGRDFAHGLARVQPLPSVPSNPQEQRLVEETTEDGGEVHTESTESLVAPSHEPLFIQGEPACCEDAKPWETQDRLWDEPTHVPWMQTPQTESLEVLTSVSAREQVPLQAADSTRASVSQVSVAGAGARASRWLVPAVVSALVWALVLLLAFLGVEKARGPTKTAHESVLTEPKIRAAQKKQVGEALEALQAGRVSEAQKAWQAYRAKWSSVEVELLIEVLAEQGTRSAR